MRFANKEGTRRKFGTAPNLVLAAFLVLMGCTVSHVGDSSAPHDQDVAADAGLAPADSGVPDGGPPDASPALDAGPLPLCESGCWRPPDPNCPMRAPEDGEPCEEPNQVCEYCGPSGPIIFTEAYCSERGWSVYADAWCEG